MVSAEFRASVNGWSNLFTSWLDDLRDYRIQKSINNQVIEICLVLFNTQQIFIVRNFVVGISFETLIKRRKYESDLLQKAFRQMIVN